MLAIILVSTVQLAIDNPLNDPQNEFSKALNVIETVLTSIFMFEAVLKIIATGFIGCGSTSYIRSGWNILDLIVLFISVWKPCLSYNVYIAFVICNIVEEPEFD
jgi:Ion transport protein